MSLHALGDDYGVLREMLRELAGAGLDAAAPVTGAADLERIALGLVGPLADPEVPAEVAALLPEALGERGDALAAGLLVALERLAPGALARPAAAARARLARLGVASPFEDEIGTLALEESYSLVLGGHEAEILGALLRRPGAELVQAAVVMLEHGPSGAVVVRALITGPEHPDAARSLLVHAHPDIEAEPLPSGALARGLLAALGHMVEHEIELPFDMLAAVLLLERALGSRLGNWPIPPLAPSAEVAEADAALVAAANEIDALVESFADSLVPGDRLDPQLLEHGPRVVASLLHWKIDYALDGQLDSWTSDELREYLLDWYPRLGDSDPEVVAAVTTCASAFLTFLAECGALRGESLAHLLATLLRLQVRFEREALDRSRFGIAKSLATAMSEEGVDPSDPDAVETWLGEFNTRSYAERDRVLGPALDALGAGPAGARREERRTRPRRDVRPPRRSKRD